MLRYWGCRMTDLEKMINIFLRDIYVSIPCKIAKLDGMYADVEPLIYDNTKLPIVPKVPILFIGNKEKKLKFKNKIGDIISVFFTQLDIGQFLAKGKAGQVSSKERFNLTNAFALPFCVHPQQQGEQMPSLDFEIIGDIKIKGNIEMEGDITQTGNQNITGAISATDAISSDIDCVSSGISGKDHIHPYYWTGTSGSDSTSKPK